MKQESTWSNKLLPASVIEQAVAGDELAMRKVLQHFDGYIAYKATMRVTDEYGRVFSQVDQELRDRLIAKLMAKVLAFRLDY